MSTLMQHPCPRSGGSISRETDKFMTLVYLCVNNRHRRPTPTENIRQKCQIPLPTTPPHPPFNNITPNLKWQSVVDNRTSLPSPHLPRHVSDFANRKPPSSPSGVGVPRKKVKGYLLAGDILRRMVPKSPPALRGI